MSITASAQHLIEQYRLSPHPEGGYYREVHRSTQQVDSPVSALPRSAMTHIYFLLAAGQISRFHKVLHDEIWNFYAGMPIRLVTYDGAKVSEETIGPGCDSYVSVVNGGVYQAAESTGAYSLLGCTVAPGFDFDDFSFLSDKQGAVKQLSETHPDYQRFI